MPVEAIALNLWTNFVDYGLPLAFIFVLALLVPRLGRFLLNLFDQRLNHADPDTKARLALFGALIYIGNLLIYFLLFIWALHTLGFSLAGAAIPATVVSAALGLGAQSIIADFLAGFFIITEKQYGVGDWVEFRGNGVDVEGDVIQITMRATTVRTLSGETAIIPNSRARVAINHSNRWARAVVLIPIPLLGSTSVYEAIERSTEAAMRALELPTIAEDVSGELQVHPAVKIESPTVVGMPWMMDMRFVVQVSAARQWAVERAIRTAIVEEFWEEYGSATTTQGSVRTQLLDFQEDPAGSGTAAGRHYAVGEFEQRLNQAPKAGNGAAASTPESLDLGAKASGNSGSATQSTGITQALPAATAAGALAAESLSARVRQRREQGYDFHSRYLHVENPAKRQQFLQEMHDTAHQINRGDVPPLPHEAADDHTPTPLRYTHWLTRLLSLGNRFRPSTTVLFIILGVIVLLSGLTYTDESENDGVLAPQRIHGNRSSVITSSTVPEVEQPVISNRVPELESTPEPTETTVTEGETTEEVKPADEGAEATATSPDPSSALESTPATSHASETTTAAPVDSATTAATPTAATGETGGTGDGEAVVNTAVQNSGGERAANPGNAGAAESTAATN